MATAATSRRPFWRNIGRGKPNADVEARELGMTRAQIAACRAVIRDAPLLNLDDAKYALGVAAANLDTFLRLGNVLSLIPGASAEADAETLASRLQAAAEKDPAAARAWRRFQHLELPYENWQHLVVVMEEDARREVAKWE